MSRILVLLAILASPAFAQPVTIRSGDHERFVRLVFAIPEGTVWEVGRINGGIGIRFGSIPEGISIDGIFDRIPRNRIEDVTVDGDVVAVRLACDCHPDAFLWQSDRLVVDIVDGPSPSRNPFEQQLEFAGEPLAVEAPRSVALPLLISDSSRQGSLEELLPYRFQSSRSQIDEAQIALVSSLARAATEGFFDIPIEPVQRTFAEEGTVGDGRRGVIGLSPVTDPMTGLSGLMDLEDSPGLTLRSALTDSLSPDGTLDEETAGCLPERAFDVTAWGDDRDFAVQISERRAGLTEEFDNYPPGAIEALARTYVYFGFGVEARRVLTLDGALTSERILLDELARIVDGADVPSGRVAQQIGCGGAASLWSILAAGDIANADDDIRGEAIRAFRNLPKAMREHLGPRFASLFVDAGVPERGQEIIELVDRRDGLVPVEVELVRADLDAASGAPAMQEERLGTLAADNVRMPSAALAELLLIQIQSGDPPPTELIELAQVYLYEARPSGGDAVLADAVVRSWIARSEIDLAEHALETFVPTDTDMFRPLVNELMSAKVGEVSDQAFLELALVDLDPLIGSQVENQVANRLIDMGFPQEALGVMELPNDAGSAIERRYLRATAFAQLGNVPLVEQELDGLADDRAREIRIAALSRAADYRGALEESLAGPDQGRQGEFAWRAGDWQVLETNEDELLRSVSLLAQEPTFLAPNLAELEARNVLLEDAVRTREMAEDLLGRYSLEEDQISANE